VFRKDSLSLGLFIFRFLSIFNPCFVCLYDVYTSVRQCVFLWFFLSLLIYRLLTYQFSPVIPHPLSLTHPRTRSLIHTHSLTLSSPYMSLILYGISHVLHTLSTPSLSMSLGRKVLFVLCLGLLINRALTADATYTHKRPTDRPNRDGRVHMAARTRETHRIDRTTWRGMNWMAIVGVKVFQ